MSATTPRYSVSELHFFASLGWARRNARRQSERRRGQAFVIIHQPERGYAAIRHASLDRYELGDDCTVVETVGAE